jgi:hypothetical protein
LTYAQRRFCSGATIFPYMLPVLKQAAQLLFIVLTVVGGVLLPHETHASPNTTEGTGAPAVRGYVPLAPLPVPGMDGVRPVTVGEFFLAAYQVGVSLAILLAVIMIMYGGIRYMVTSSSQTKGAAKDIIEKAFIGLLLAVGGYSLLFLIGGRQAVDVRLDFPEIAFTPPPPFDIHCHVTRSATTRVPPRDVPANTPLCMDLFGVDFSRDTRAPLRRQEWERARDVTACIEEMVPDPLLPAPGPTVLFLHQLDRSNCQARDREVARERPAPRHDDAHHPGTTKEYLAIGRMLSSPFAAAPNHRDRCQGMTWDHGVREPRYRTHNGIDFAQVGCNSYGDPVYPVYGGTVVRAGYGSGGTGYRVVIRHEFPNGMIIKSHYYHLIGNSIPVRAGQWVTTGMRIGSIGNTGRVAGVACPRRPGTHLHLGFERYDTGPRDPRVPRTRHFYDPIIFFNSHREMVTTLSGCSS